MRDMVCLSYVHAHTPITVSDVTVIFDSYNTPLPHHCTEWQVALSKWMLFVFFFISECGIQENRLWVCSWLKVIAPYMLRLFSVCFSLPGCVTDSNLRARATHKLSTRRAVSTRSTFNSASVTRVRCTQVTRNKLPSISSHARDCNASLNDLFFVWTNNSKESVFIIHSSACTGTHVAQHPCISL